MKENISHRSILTFPLCGFSGHFAGAERFHNNLTRSRVAYLLRAARSRGPGNAVSTETGYFLRDCRYIITRVRVAQLS